MIALIMLILSIAIMCKVAELEGRSSIVWGFATFLSCVACSTLIPLPLLNIFIGLALCYGAMFALKLAQA